MMQPLKYFLILSVSLLLISCGTTKVVEPEPEVITKTEYVYNRLEIGERPDPIKMKDVSFMVVSDENLEEFLEKVKRRTGETIFVAFRIRDYEALSVNMAELKRFIEQQKNLIVYYEETIRKNNNAKE